MENRILKLTNTEGLHARPAAIFVKVANRFHSDLEIATAQRKVNGKSIIGIMSLGAFHGETIELFCKGPDELEMADALSRLIENGFKEV